jgi:DNA-binding PadR family transcriptional regulator
VKRPSEVEFLLLALLGADEWTGRQVAKRYDSEVGKRIPYGTLYTTFSRLRDHGWVTTRDDSDSDGRLRYFKITATGRKAVVNTRAWYGSLASFMEEE